MSVRNIKWVGSSVLILGALRHAGARPAGDLSSFPHGLVRGEGTPAP